MCKLCVSNLSKKRLKSYGLKPRQNKIAEQASFKKTHFVFSYRGKSVKIKNFDSNLKPGYSYLRNGIGLKIRRILAFTGEWPRNVSEKGVEKEETEKQPERERKKKRSWKEIYKILFFMDKRVDEV